MMRSLSDVRRRVERLLEDARMPDDDPPPDPADADAYMTWALRRFTLEDILQQVDEMQRIQVGNAQGQRVGGRGVPRLRSEY